MRWYAGIVVSVWLSAAFKCTDLDPLKQFPRVIHGTHPLQGRIAMGSPAPARGVAFGRKFWGHLIPIRIQAASALAASSAPQLTGSKLSSPPPCRLDVILNAKWN